MADVLKYNIKANGFFSSLPYIAMWIMTMIFGFTSDWGINNKYLSVTNSRKLYTTLSFAVPGCFLIAASYGGCDRVLAVTLFTVGMGFMGAYYSGNILMIGLYTTKYSIRAFRYESQCSRFISKFCWYIDGFYKWNQCYYWNHCCKFNVNLKTLKYLTFDCFLSALHRRCFDTE